MKREHEITEIENDSMRTLLSGLKRIEAPGDFDFRVKARIAHGRPADRSASLIPAWLRLAVPIILLVVVGGYFGFRDLNSSTAVVAGVQQPETT